MADDYFGAPVGKLGDPLPDGLSNDFATIGDRSIADMAQSNRVVPRQVGTGVMRGTQRIVNTDGSYITLGVIPDTNGEFGIAFFNRDGNIIKKTTATTDYYYDPDNDGNNVVQLGKLSNDEYGAAFAKEGEDLEEGLA